MTTGERIKFFRNERGLTQAQLAELSSISHSSIRAYEINARNPSSKAAEKIANVLGINVSDLLRDKEYLDDQDSEKMNFITDFRNGLDQLVFFDPLQYIRLDIDQIEDNEKRAFLAETLKKVFDSLASYQRHYKEVDKNCSAAEKWRDKQEFITEFLRTTEQYLDAFEDSQFNE